jgi:hypothetical protein
MNLDYEIKAINNEDKLSLDYSPNPSEHTLNACI